MTSSALKVVGAAVRRASWDATAALSPAKNLEREVVSLLSSQSIRVSNPIAGVRRKSNPVNELTQIGSQHNPNRRHSSPPVPLLDKVQPIPRRFRGYSLSGRQSSLSVVREGEFEESIPEKAPAPKVDDSLEIHHKAREIFQDVWEDMKEKYGDAISLPKEVVWLAGAPGSGKGTNTLYIQQARGIKSEPIVVSSLLDSPTCQAIKAVGGMIDDKVVLTTLLNEMAKPEFRGGVIVDGFPRTALQVEFIHLIHESYTQMNGVDPDFRVAVLHVPKEESINRQLNRGVELKLENAKRALQGLPVLEVRATDLDPMHAAGRYQAFSAHYESLLRMNGSYPFHLIDASSTKENVRKTIENELASTQSQNHVDESETKGNYGFISAIKEAIMMTLGHGRLRATNL